MLLVLLAGIAVTAWWLWGASETPVAEPTPLQDTTPASDVTPEPTATPSDLTTATPVLAPNASPTAAASATPSPTPSPQVVASPAPVVSGAPKLAIIIDDCGQWPTTERAFVALPYPLTLSVLPHVAYTTEIAHAAAAAGKGVMLHLPMENRAGMDPGPGTITTAMDDATIRTMVTDDLQQIPDATGVNNHEGSKATADPRVMNDVVAVLAADGRFFIDSRTTKLTVAEQVARAHGVRAARRNVFLDDVDSVDAVEVSLRQAAAYARANGSAIAIGHPRPATLEAVRALAPELVASGITFTLASNLVH